MTEVRARIAANIRAWAIRHYGLANYQRIEAQRAASQDDHNAR